MVRDSLLRDLDQRSPGFRASEHPLGKEAHATYPSHSETVFLELLTNEPDIVEPNVMDHVSVLETSGIGAERNRNAVAQRVYVGSRQHEMPTGLELIAATGQECVGIDDVLKHLESRDVTERSLDLELAPEITLHVAPRGSPLSCGSQLSAPVATTPYFFVTKRANCPWWHPRSSHAAPRWTWIVSSSSRRIRPKRYQGSWNGWIGSPSHSGPRYPRTSCHSNACELLGSSISSTWLSRSSRSLQLKQPRLAPALLCKRRCYPLRMTSANTDAFMKVVVGPVDHEIIALEADIRAAQLAADVDALDRLISEDLLFTGPDGNLATKQQDLDSHRSGAVRILEHEPIELRVRRVGDNVAIVALHARMAAAINGTIVRGNFRYTRVWAREDGAWRVVGGHVAPLADHLAAQNA